MCPLFHYGTNPRECFRFFPAPRVLDDVLEPPPGVGEPVGDLDEAHAGARRQLQLLGLGGVRVVAVSQQPLLQRPHHVLGVRLVLRL